MRKLLVVATLAAVAVGGWRWTHHRATDGGRNVAFNRFWVDHEPANERDPFNVFVAHTPEGFGGFAEETQWHGQIERFRFDVDGDTIDAVFPWSDTHEHIKLSARACHEQGMDYCLEISGSNHGVKRYYSRVGWSRKGTESIDAFVARAFTH